MPEHNVPLPPQCLCGAIATFWRTYSVTTYDPVEDTVGVERREAVGYCADCAAKAESAGGWEPTVVTGKP